jgi:dienelactone hydrolase
MSSMRTVPASWWHPIAAFSAVFLLGACASQPSQQPSPIYTARGPNEVGILTLNLSDRKIEVYYPAAAGAAQGRTNDVYLQTEPVPPMLAGMLKKIPESVDLKVTIPAFRDAPAAKGTAYPLVIVSHGAGGWRSGHGNVLSGIASWGFVVASVDFTEYGFASFASPSRDMAARRTSSAAALEAALDLMASSNTQGPLAGLIDMNTIAAVGHSAGGGTMFAAIDNPRIDSVIGWAPVPPQGPGATPKPTMIIAAENDSGIKVDTLVAAYDKLNAPKRLVIVPRMGHNAFSDSCLSIQSGNDLISAVKQMGLPVPGPLLDLAQNGCRPGDLDTREGWAIIQHLTVAQLRTSLGLPGAGSTLNTDLGPAFKDAPLEVREEMASGKPQ